MKATATTRKNGTKRALAGILATLSLAAVTIPTAAQAGMLTPCITASAAYISTKTENRDEIDAYFKSLDYDEESVLSANLASKDKTRDMIVRGANGNYSVVHQERAQDAEVFDTFSVMNSMSDIIYPGSLLVADNFLLAGNPTPIALKRNNIKISIANAHTRNGESVTTTVNPTNASDVYDGIKRVRDRIADGADFPAQISARIEKVESAEQVKAKMHMSQEVWGKLSLDVDAINNNKKQACMVDISQVFYTVTADNCKGADLFADDVTVDDVAYNINNDNPAVMVSSVDYGRKIIACIQTDDTSFDLKSTLETSCLGGKISGKIEGEYSKQLSDCSVKVFILGGSSEKGGQFLTMSLEQLLKIASETTGYDGYAMPISYSTRFTKSGRVAHSNYLGDKWNTVVSEARTAKKVNFTTARFGDDLTSATVKIYGKKILGINDYNRFIPSEEVLLDEITLDHATQTEGISSLDGDVLLDTVRFVFSYEGENHKELENGGAIKLYDAFVYPEYNLRTSRNASQAIQTLDDIHSIEIGFGKSIHPDEKGNSFRRPVERRAYIEINTEIEKNGKSEISKSGLTYIWEKA